MFLMLKLFGRGALVLVILRMMKLFIGTVLQPPPSYMSWGTSLEGTDGFDPTTVYRAGICHRHTKTM